MTKTFTLLILQGLREEGFQTVGPHHYGNRKVA